MAKLMVMVARVVEDVYDVSWGLRLRKMRIEDGLSSHSQPLNSTHLGFISPRGDLFRVVRSRSRMVSFDLEIYYLLFGMFRYL